MGAHNSIDTLSKLKSQLRDILGLFDRNSRIYYVDYPTHSNVGDLLINLGTEQFFRDYDIPICERYSLANIGNISASKTDANVTLLCHGGGNFGDIYSEHQDLRERLLKDFPKARIIFLPQTIYYSSEAKQSDSFRKIAAHPNCHILVRDQESLHALQGAHLTQSSLMPDMAHQLWNVIEPSREREIGNDIYFLRRDRESTPIPPEFTAMFLRGYIDWNDTISAPHKALTEAAQYFLNIMGGAMSPDFSASLWYAVRDGMISDAIAYFSRHDRIYTNRLHAMLLGLMLGHDITVFDNSYNKLWRYINTWSLSS